jgi:hypothetical protein
MIVVEANAVAQGSGIHGHAVDDVPHAARAPQGFVELFLEQAAGLGDGDLLDPGHDAPPALSLRRTPALAAKQRRQACVAT